MTKRTSDQVDSNDSNTEIPATPPRGNGPNSNGSNTIFVPETPSPKKTSPKKRRTLTQLPLGSKPEHDKLLTKIIKSLLDASIEMKDYTAAVDNFITLCADYAASKQAIEPAVVRELAQYYIDLFPKAQEINHKFKDLNQIARDLILENDNNFLPPLMYETYNAHQAVLSAMNGNYEEERDCILAAIEAASLQLGASDASGGSNAALRIKHYFQCLKQSSDKEEKDKDDKNDSDVAYLMAQSMIRAGNKLVEYIKYFEVGDLAAECNATAYHLRAIAVNTYADLAYSLADLGFNEQKPETWDRVFVYAKNAITEHKSAALTFIKEFKEIERFIRITLAQMQNDEASNPDTYHDRLLYLNTQLLHLYNESKHPEHTAQKKASIFVQVRNNISSLITESEKGIRPAGPVMLQKLKNWQQVCQNLIDKDKPTAAQIIRDGSSASSNGNVSNNPSSASRQNITLKIPFARY